MSDDPNSSPARIILVGGGARSGKSRFALARARRLGARRVFVATGQALDAEMAERIAVHVRTRGDDFRTVEEPLALPEALVTLGCGERASDAGPDVVVVDCLTLWLSNLICRGDSEAVVAEQVDALGAALARRRFHAIVVSNEVGLGIVPEAPLARLFRDVVGRAHQQLAALADEIHLAILGTILRLRPEPLAVDLDTSQMGTLEGLALHSVPPPHPPFPALRAASPNPPAMGCDEGPVSAPRDTKEPTP